MVTEFKIDGTKIKRPTEFKHSYYDITNANRLQDGTMSMELIAQKEKFFFTYEVLTSDELNNILNLIWRSRKMFFTLSYVEDNTWHSAVVYKGEIQKSLYRSSKEGGPWVYKDFTFNLIER